MSSFKTLGLKLVTVYCMEYLDATKNWRDLKHDDGNVGWCSSGDAVLVEFHG